MIQYYNPWATLRVRVNWRERHPESAPALEAFGLRPSRGMLYNGRGDLEAIRDAAVSQRIRCIGKALS